MDSADFKSLLNANPGVGLTESGGNALRWMHGLHTSRNFYDAELDMLLLGNAESTTQGTQEVVTKHDREYTYRGLPATRVKNTGLRVFYPWLEDSFRLGLLEDSFIPYLTLPFIRPKKPTPEELKICQQVPEAGVYEWYKWAERAHECYRGYLLYTQEHIAECAVDVDYVMRYELITLSDSFKIVDKDYKYNNQNVCVYDFEIVGSELYWVYINCELAFHGTNAYPQFFTWYLPAGTHSIVVHYKRVTNIPPDDLTGAKNFGYVGFIVRRTDDVHYFTRAEGWKGQVGILTPPDPILGVGDELPEAEKCKQTPTKPVYETVGGISVSSGFTGNLLHIDPSPEEGSIAGVAYLMTGSTTLSAGGEYEFEIAADNYVSLYVNCVKVFQDIKRAVPLYPLWCKTTIPAGVVKFTLIYQEQEGDSPAYAGFILRKGATEGVGGVEVYKTTAAGWTGQTNKATIYAD